MLNADLIGFHIFEFARHFLTCCKRMLGLEYEFRESGFIGVKDHKRDVLVQVAFLPPSPTSSHFSRHLPPPLALSHPSSRLVPPFLRTLLLTLERGVLVQVSHVGIEPDLCRAEQLTGEAATTALLGGMGTNGMATGGVVGGMVGGVGSVVGAVAGGGGLGSPGGGGGEEARRFAQQLLALRELKASGKTLMLGMDEMERLKGLPLKLIAFEQLLCRLPADERDRMTLVQVGVRARNFTPAVQVDFDELRDEVLEVVARINGAFAGSVVFVEVPTIALAQRMQLWALADVTCFTPVREGVNSFPLEAVYARREGAPGVIILSEFSSSARVLNGALRVNPWNTEEVTDAMERACSMQPMERLARRERDLQVGRWRLLPCSCREALTARAGRARWPPSTIALRR